MKRFSAYITSLVILLLGTFVIQSYAQEARRTGEIAKIDAATKAFVVKTQRGETNIVTTDSTVYKEGDKQITFADLKVGDNIAVLGVRKGNDVEAKEVTREAK